MSVDLKWSDIFISLLSVLFSFTESNCTLIVNTVAEAFHGHVGYRLLNV